MRVLLDECVPRGLRKDLIGCEVKTVGKAGWAGVKNGALLQLAAKAGRKARVRVNSFAEISAVE